MPFAVNKTQSLTQKPACGSASMTSGTVSRRQVLATGLATVPLLSKTALAKPQARFGINGQPAPELNVEYWIGGNGEPADFSIAASAGKWVFLKCFQNWCPGCHSSGFPTLKAFADEFHDHPKVAIAAIQTVFEGFRTNTREAVRELQLRYDLPIVMGHDPGGQTAEDGDHRPQTMVQYRTGGTPWIILIDPTGTVVFNDFRINRTRLIEFIHEQVA